ncbi:MAG: type II secretion system GspH family protein [Vicinamibacteria bacterium]|nr:type II secretion system GspH family protein [Vicinamibacteria bacterium]
MKKTPPRPTPSGYSLLELMVSLGIILLMGSVALPNIIGFRQEAALLGAAQGFKAEFMRARSVATMKNTQTAIRFETDAAGRTLYSTYIDGNFNGVLTADIATGIDTRIAGPFRLDAGQAGVDVGVLPGAPSPEGGLLGSEPIRFGNARMVSFSPLGTGTPGTFYLRTRSSMAGVRVTGGSARVRIMILRGKRWVDRQG